MASALALDSAIQAFVQSRRAMNLSPQSLFNYETTLRRFARQVAPGVHLVREVTPDELRNWIIYLQSEHRDSRAKDGAGRPLTSETVLAYFVRVRTFLRWLHREGLLKKDPTSRVDRPKVERREVPALSDADASALLNLFTQAHEPYETSKFLGPDRRRFLLTRDRAFVALLLDTALRLKEAMMLDVADVDFAERTVKTLGKGRRERRAPFGPAALRLLQAWLRERNRAFANAPELFLTVSGGAITENAIRNLFRTAKRRLGVRGRLSAHVLRHTAATLALRNGASTFEVMKFLGHVSPTITARYVNMLPEDLIRGHRTWSPVERLLRGR